MLSQSGLDLPTLRPLRILPLPLRRSLLVGLSLLCFELLTLNLGKLLPLDLLGNSLGLGYRFSRLREIVLGLRDRSDEWLLFQPCSLENAETSPIKTASRCP